MKNLVNDTLPAPADLKDDWYNEHLKEMYGEDFDKRYILLNIYNSRQLVFYGLIAEERRENEFVCFQNLYVMTGFLSISLSINKIHNSPIQLYLLKGEENKVSYQGYVSDIETKIIINIYISNTLKDGRDTLYIRVKTQTQKEFIKWSK